MRFALLAMVAVLLGVCSEARAAVPAKCETTETPYVCGIEYHQQATAAIRARKCLERIPVLVPAAQTSARWRPAIMRRWALRHRIALSASKHRCRPTYPPDIIRAVMPDNVEGTMIDVAWCESARPQGGTIRERWARAVRAANPSSSARGLFQELSSWWGSHNNFQGRPFNPYDPWANTKQALWLLNHGGLGHWAASRSCWG